MIFPYLCLAVFVVGHWWRYKYDKFGWTTRSSQLYEDNLLKWAARSSTSACSGSSVVTSSACCCRRWTDAIGISEETYHAFALAAGSSPVR